MRTFAASEKQLKLLDEYGLEGAQLRRVSLCRYERGEYLCMAGGPLGALMIFVSGRAKVSFTAYNGRSLLLGFYDACGLIGDLEFMIGSQTARMSVQAVTPVFCLAVPLEANGQGLRENPRFLLRAGRAVAEKLSDSNGNCAQIILYPLETRLSAYIAATAEDGCFREKLTETAELLGSGYRHLMRALSSLCDRKILEKRDKGYYIIDREALLQNGTGRYP